MIKTTCKVPGCNRERRHSNGYCPMHYARWRKTGDPGPAESSFRTKCSFLGCDGKHQSRGLCASHASQLRRTGELRPLRERHSREGQCRVKSCARERFCLGYCAMHYSRLQRRGELGGAQPATADQTARDSEGRKRCFHCETWKPEGDFGKSKDRRDGLQIICKMCDRARQQGYKYNLSAAEIADLLESQGGHCAICSATDPATPSGNWNVDHDHACCPGRKSCGQCVRGLLCSRCNVMLGMSLDRPGILRDAAVYLETHSRAGRSRAV